RNWITIQLANSISRGKKSMTINSENNNERVHYETMNSKYSSKLSAHEINLSFNRKLKDYLTTGLEISGSLSNGQNQQEMAVNSENTKEKTFREIIVNSEHLSLRPTLTFK